MVHARSLTRDWSLCAVAGVALALSGQCFADPIGQDRGDVRPSAQSHGVPANGARLSEAAAIQQIGERIASALETLNRNADSADAKKNARAALRAQEDAAGWAGGLFWIGLLELMVTCAGVTLVGLTLKEAKRSADAASDSAEAAQASAEAALRAMDRPWLWISSVQRLNRIPNVGQELPFARIIIRNYGTAPGVIHVAKAVLFYSPGPGLTDAFLQAVGEMPPTMLSFPEPGEVARFIYGKGRDARQESSRAQIGPLSNKIESTALEDGIIVENSDVGVPLIFTGHATVNTDDSAGLPIEVAGSLYLIGMITYFTANEDSETLTFCYEQKGVGPFHRRGGSPYNQRSRNLPAKVAPQVETATGRPWWHRNRKK